MHGLQQLELAFVLLLWIHCGSANVTYAQFNCGWSRTLINIFGIVINALALTLVTLYKQMPPLYQLEDYDLCLDKPPNHLLSHSTYCLVYAEVVPNASSSLWQQIDALSRDEKHRFRHDHLFLGVCLERCKRALHELSHFQVQQLYEGKVTDVEVSPQEVRGEQLIVRLCFLPAEQLLCPCAQASVGWAHSLWTFDQFVPESWFRTKVSAEAT